MTERDEGAPSFTKRISEIGLLAAVLIYFTGWTFISELFRQFGLSSHVIDIPVYSVFVYAYDALYKTAWGWVTMGVGVAVFASAAFVKPSRLSMTSYLFLGMISFPALYGVATNAATHRANVIRSGHSFGVIAIPRPNVSYPTATIVALQGDDLSIIATTKDVVYVVKQSSKTFGGTLAQGRTFILPLDDFAISIKIPPAPKVN